jgi:uncharacterized protein (TIGR02147 family)
VKPTEIQPHASATLQPSQLLRDAYLERKRKNEAYSLRAFARDIGMSQPLLSLVLNGQRPLTLKQAHKVVALLGLNSVQEKRFIEATLASLPQNAKITQRVRLARERIDVSFLPRNLDIEKYHAIASWHHFAILDLATTTRFRSDPAWIASRLGLSRVEAADAIERLLLLGLLRREGGRLVKSSLHIQFPTRESRAAVRAFHQQMIGKAQEQLHHADPESFARRSITGHTVAVDTSRLDEAREFISAMQAEFIRRFSVGTPDEVYQLNIQLFPLTQTQKESLR